MMNLLVIVLCSWVLYRIWTFWLYPKLYSPLNRLPQLKEDQNVSTAARVLREPSGRQIHHRLQETQHASVGLVRSKGVLGGERVIVTSDMALGEILRQPDLYEIPPQRRLIVRHLTGDGLIVASGEIHKHQRRNLAPAFAHANIRKCYGLFWKKAFEFVMLLSKEPQDKSGSATVDMHAWSGRLAMDNIGVAVFGTDFGLLADDQTEFSTKYINAFGANPINGIRIKLSFLLPGWLFERLPLKTKSLQEASAFIRAKCAECIDQARQINHGEKKASSHADTICRVALDSKAFSDHNLEDQLMTILAAGHTTSQTALSSTAALLSQHQEIQQRLRTEIAQLVSSSELLGSESDDVIAKVVQLPYLQAICHESLRLFPPVPTMRRRVARSTTLLNYSMPKHTLLVISPWVVHRDPLHWGPDACEFRPARWLDGASGDVPGSLHWNARGGSTGKNSFLTFMHGPKNCIGQVFASAELAISVAVLIMNFQLKPGEKAPIWEHETVSKPTEGIEMVLTPILKP